MARSKALTPRAMFVRAGIYLLLCIGLAYPRVYVDVSVVTPSLVELAQETLKLYFMSGFAALCLSIFIGFRAENARPVFQFWLAALLFFALMLLLSVHWSPDPAMYLNPVPPAPEGS